MRVLARFLFIALVANFEFAGFRKENKYTAYDHFHGNGPYGKKKKKKEPIRMLGFIPRLLCHVIIVYYLMLSAIP